MTESTPPIIEVKVLVLNRVPKPFLKIGITCPFFQLSGRLPEVKDFANNKYDGKQIDSAVSMITTGSQPSGPGGLEILI